MKIKTNLRAGAARTSGCGGGGGRVGGCSGGGGGVIRVLPV